MKDLSTPTTGAKGMYLSTEYSRSLCGQFISCLWKQWWTYWRTPDYNLVRYFFTLAATLMIATVIWKNGKKVITKLLYMLFQTTLFSLIVYFMMGFEWATTKFFCFFCITYAAFLYFTYYGVMIVSITPNHQVAAMFAAVLYR